MIAFLAGLLVVVTIVFKFAFSWIITVGLVKLVTLLFGLTFSWAWATGIWIVLLVLKSIFSRK